MEKKFLTKVTPFDLGGKVEEVTFALGNGQKLVADVTKFPEEIRDRLMYHGLSQKIGDSTSGFSKERRFGDALAMMQDVYDSLCEGKWELRGGGGVSDLVQAIAMLKGLEVEDVRLAVKRADDDKIKAWKSNAAIKAKMAEIVAARAQAAVKDAAASVDDIEIDIEE